MEEAKENLGLRWRKQFEMAWEGKGFIIDLHKVPDGILDDFLEWRRQKHEQEAEHLPPMPGA